MNKVLLTGRLTRDPEMRSLASGKSVTQNRPLSDQSFLGQGDDRRSDARWTDRRGDGRQSGDSRTE